MSDCCFPGECRASRACYTGHGCRGSACRDAEAEYRREWKRSRERPDVIATAGRVGTGQVRSHLEMLRAAGLGLGRIAALAGMRENTVWLIATGRQASVTLETREALLAVMPSMVAPSVLVDAGPVVEQLELLLDAGWSELELAGYLFGRRDRFRIARVLVSSRTTQRIADAVALLAREEFPPEEELGGDPLAEFVLLASDSGWRAEAECLRLAGDAKARQRPFFPTRGEPKVARDACARCEVKEPCLAFALDTNEKHGVWGATTGGDRRLIRRLGWSAEQVLAVRAAEPETTLLDLLERALAGTERVAV